IRRYDWMPSHEGDSFKVGGFTMNLLRAQSTAAACLLLTALVCGASLENALAAVTNVIVWGNAYGATPANLQSVEAIGTGWYHSFARRGDGSAVLWGNNNYNQTVIPPGVTDIVAMAGGEEHTIVLHGNGTVDAWGEDFYGQCDLQPGLRNIVAVAAGTF